MKLRSQRLSLALQGGGSHGAFTWGVLDRLLQDQGLRLDGISGTSAGAMNTVSLAHGLAVGGRQGAREALDAFWHAVAEASPLPPPSLTGNANVAAGTQTHPAHKSLAKLTRYLSPQQFNPLDINPLRDIIDQQIDFSRLRGRGVPRLFVIATRIRDGQMRVFTNRELSTDALLASACLPSLHHPIEIDGETYWDGGFSGNPAVFPLVYDARARDIVAVLLQPLHRDDTPNTAEAISRRMRELGLISPFLREMRALARVRREAGGGLFTAGGIERRIRRLRFYLIQHEELMGRLAQGSQFNTHLGFLTMLKEAGQERGEAWLQDYHRDPGATQIDLQALFG